MRTAVLALLAMSLSLGCKSGPASKGGRPVECLTGSGVTAQERLKEIEKLAPSKSKLKEMAGKLKKAAIRPQDMANVHRAHAATRAAMGGVKKDKQDRLLQMAEDSLELVPMNLRTWPDVDGVIYPDKTMEQLLNDIISWAGTTEPTARQLAMDCRDVHFGMGPEHVLHVEFAWEYARDAKAATNDPLLREVNWLLCVSELTHGPGGGAPAK